MYIQNVNQQPRGVPEDPLAGPAPQTFWGTAALDGTATPFVEAAIGSEYVRSSAGVVAKWVKTVNNGATADWFAVPMSTALVTAAELDFLDGATAGTVVASKAVIANSASNIGVVKATALHIGTSGSEIQVNATAAEINNAADVSARTQELTASGAVTAGVQTVELNHASVVVAATIASAANHQGLFVVKDTSATGTAAHTLTLTAGTFNGTNNVATLNARDECLVVYFDSTGRGTIVVNVGAVGLS